MIFQKKMIELLKTKIKRNVQPKAKIFLSDERGCSEADWFRRYSTFNFGNYFNEHKYPFQNLFVLNDETIAGGHSINFVVEECSHILLLPVVGSVLCNVNQSIESIVHPGQLNLLEVNKTDVVELSNCYKDELINFIQVWIKTNRHDYTNTGQLFNFGLDENKNNLIAITEPNTLAKNVPVVSIGKFAGRNEATYNLQNKQNSLFIFVIQGVFEVQGRLLHAKDGLGFLNEPEDIEIEALSNDAILFIVEFS
jgi:quercetin 2,3-dioxygenase